MTGLAIYLATLFAHYKIMTNIMVLFHEGRVHSAILGAVAWLMIIMQAE